MKVAKLDGASVREVKPICEPEVLKVCANPSEKGGCEADVVQFADEPRFAAKPESVEQTDLGKTDDGNISFQPTPSHKEGPICQGVVSSCVATTKSVCDSMQAQPISCPQPERPVVHEELALSNEQKSRMKNLLSELGSQQGNRGRKVWDRATSCFVCSRKKHSCKWALRDRAALVGAWCHACICAAAKLQCTKTRSVLIACPDVLAILQRRSAQYVRWMTDNEGDDCACKTCKDLKKMTWKPTTRCRGKTTLVK